MIARLFIIDIVTRLNTAAAAAAPRPRYGGGGGGGDGGGACGGDDTDATQSSSLSDDDVVVGCGRLHGFYEWCNVVSQLTVGSECWKVDSQVP